MRGWWVWWPCRDAHNNGQDPALWRQLSRALREAMVLRQFGVLMALRLRGLRELQRQCPAPQPALSQAVARLSVSGPSPHARMQAPAQVSRVEQHVLASQDDARRQRPRGVQQPKTQVPTTKADGRKPGGTAKKRVKRRRIPYLASFTPRPELPSLDALVVVEGIADGRAVAAAVNAPVGDSSHCTMNSLV
ncbi:unnamed protein product [Ostreobium quekettii]|uniref:Uncharacterized protein n=1 Tax=Ostreobium quekettii TaxID=121088 RepID=A0A8S1J6F7_9CHLO|nr:unnamed protein product [Ostreobium quekettii]